MSFLYSFNKCIILNVRHESQNEETAVIRQNLLHFNRAYILIGRIRQKLSKQINQQDNSNNIQFYEENETGPCNRKWLEELGWTAWSRTTPLTRWHLTWVLNSQGRPAILRPGEGRRVSGWRKLLQRPWELWVWWVVWTERAVRDKVRQGQNDAFASIQNVSAKRRITGVFQVEQMTGCILLEHVTGGRGNWETSWENSSQLAGTQEIFDATYSLLTENVIADKWLNFHLHRAPDKQKNSVDYYHYIKLLIFEQNSDGRFSIFPVLQGKDWQIMVCGWPAAYFCMSCELRMFLYGFFFF